MTTGQPLAGGVETGGTKTICAIGSGPNDVYARTEFPTTSPAETLGQVVRFFAEHQSSGVAVAALGIASFGPLDVNSSSPTYGRITTTPKQGWDNVDVLGHLRERICVPTVLDTDVNAAAYGEFRWGAIAGLDPGVYVTVGTGIGGGIVAAGRVVHGLLHPEMGHLPVTRHPLDTFEGHCRFHGDCLEGLASGPAILARTGLPPGQLGPDGQDILAIEAFYLAQLVSTLVYVISPQRVVLGGGVLKLPGLIDAVRCATRDRLAGALTSAALASGIGNYIVVPRLGDLAGVVGAIALAQRLIATKPSDHDAASRLAG